MIEFWSRKGEPMELIEWATAYEDVVNRTVAIDADFEQDRMVSTVWEGMARPVLMHDYGVPVATFETALLVNGKVTDWVRTNSEEDALLAHNAWCEMHLGRPARPEDGYVQKRIDGERLWNG